MGRIERTEHSTTRPRTYPAVLLACNLAGMDVAGGSGYGTMSATVERYREPPEGEGTPELLTASFEVSYRLRAGEVTLVGAPSWGQRTVEGADWIIRPRAVGREILIEVVGPRDALYEHDRRKARERAAEEAGLAAQCAAKAADPMLRAPGAPGSPRLVPHARGIPGTATVEQEMKRVKAKRAELDRIGEEAAAAELQRLDAIEEATIVEWSAEATFRTHYLEG